MIDRTAHDGRPGCRRGEGETPRPIRSAAGSGGGCRKREAGRSPARARAAPAAGGGAAPRRPRHGAGDCGGSGAGGEHGGLVVRLGQDRAAPAGREARPRPPGAARRRGASPPPRRRRRRGPGSAGSPGRGGLGGRAGTLQGRHRPGGRDREPLRQLDGGLPALVAEAQEDAGVRRGDAAAPGSGRGGGPGPGAA